MGDDYGYTVRDDAHERSILTMASRHDAVGLVAILDRVSDHTHSVDPVRHTSEGELTTLVPMEETA